LVDVAAEAAEGEEEESPLDEEELMDELS